MVCQTYYKESDSLGNMDLNGDQGGFYSPECTAIDLHQHLSYS